MSIQQKPDYEFRILSDLAFAEMVYSQGNNHMAEVAYKEALNDLLSLKGRVPEQKFNMLRQIIISGLEQINFSVLMEETGVKGYFQAEKLLGDAGNPLVAKYQEKMRGVSEEARILDESLPVHETPC